MNRLVRAILVLMLLVTGLGRFGLARQPELKRSAIEAGRLLDVRTGKITTDVVLIIEGDRIASLGGNAPAGVPLIDLSGVTVLPGLIDVHDHILGNPKGGAVVKNDLLRRAH